MNDTLLPHVPSRYSEMLCCTYNLGSSLVSLCFGTNKVINSPIDCLLRHVTTVPHCPAGSTFLLPPQWPSPPNSRHPPCSWVWPLLEFVFYGLGIVMNLHPSMVCFSQFKVVQLHSNQGPRDPGCESVELTWTLL